MTTKQQRLVPLVFLIIILGSLIGGLVWHEQNTDHSGWQEKDGIRYYQDFHGDPVSGWLDLPEGRYYFQEDGTPSHGWQTIDGTTYYFDSDGIMLTGWQTVDGETCYFGGNGAMVTGWLWLPEGRYYLKDGALLTGWQELDGKRCYFGADGLAADGFTQIGADNYFFVDGFLATGLTEIDGALWYFGEDGKQYSGWLEEEGGRRYFSPQGPMITGWQDMEDGKRLFDDSGYLTVGWHEEGEYRYYFKKDGLMAVSPTKIDGKTHYFSPKGIEVILVNGLNPLPKDFALDEWKIDDTHTVDKRCYSALRQMLDDCTAAGITYEVNSGYRTHWSQTAILEYRTREHMKTYNLDFREARDKALETVAVPGTSEHELGLSVDLVGDEADAWFAQHCWEYGFILRYTADKESITGITDEPWHFRYVGREVSMDMKDSGLCLEEYLGAESVNMQKVRALFGEKLYEETIYGKDEETAEETKATEETKAPKETTTKETTPKAA